MRNAAVYVTDQNGYELTRHAAASLILSQRDIPDVHIFCHRFAPDQTDRLIELGRENSVRVHLETIEDTRFIDKGPKGRIPTTVFLKLSVVERLIPMYDRILYVDYDILFLNAIDIANITFDGHPVAAVYDLAHIGGRLEPNFAECCREHGLSEHYFNAGFMLFDCARWDSRFTDTYQELVNAHQTSCGYTKGKCTTNDQCVFNMLFSDRWKKLPIHWNMQSCAKFTNQWTGAAVRHYQGAHKFLPARPWRNDARDTALLNQIRDALGYQDRLPALSSVLFPLNRIRKNREARWANTTIAQAEEMTSGLSEADTQH